MTLFVARTSQVGGTGTTVTFATEIESSFACAGIAGRATKKSMNVAAKKTMRRVVIYGYETMIAKETLVSLFQGQTVY